MPKYRHFIVFGSALALLIILNCEGYAGNNSTDVSMAAKDPAVADVLALDHKYWEAERLKDWPAVVALVAPDYYSIGEDFESDYKELQSEFPKIQLYDYHIGSPHVRRLSNDSILVSYVATMHETYDGKDISGRYWCSTLWVQRNKKWLLLVEEEVRLDSTVPP